MHKTKRILLLFRSFYQNLKKLKHKSKLKKLLNIIEINKLAKYVFKKKKYNKSQFKIKTEFEDLVIE